MEEDRSYPKPYEPTQPPKKFEETQVPALSPSNPPPILKEPTPPPSLKEEREPPVLAAESIDVSNFVAFLHQINSDTDQFWKAFGEMKDFIGLSERKPLKSEKITKAVGSEFTHYREVDGGLIAVGSVIQEGLNNQKKFNLLLNQTKSWCEQLNIPKSLRPKLEKEPLSSPFILRQMTLMVLVHTPHLFELVVPAGISDYVREDYLLELAKPTEEVSLFSLMTLLKAFGITCLIVVEEGKEGLSVHPPIESDKNVSNRALYGVGDHFYILERALP